MIERSPTHQQEDAEKTGERYLANLGLNWNDLRGKKVLDIGALSGEFENAARRRGVHVTSMDKELVDENMPPADSQFVAANATKLPFKDESFDYAVSHMSVMNYLEKGYHEEDYLLYIGDTLREACRVLRPGGRYHFMQTVLKGEELLRGADDVVPTPRKSDVYRQWHIEREHQLLEEIAKKAGFRDLKLGKQHETNRKRPEGDEHILHYYIALK